MLLFLSHGKCKRYHAAPSDSQTGHGLNQLFTEKIPRTYSLVPLLPRELRLVGSILLINLRRGTIGSFRKAEVDKL